MGSDWTTKAKWMREMGATAATWEGETLTSLSLGPAPVVDKAEPVEPMTPEEVQQQLRAERARVSFAAASGLVGRADIQR